MNVVIVGSSKFDSLEFHLADELKHQGNQVTIVDYQKLFTVRVDWALTMVSEKFEVRKNKKLLDKIIERNPQLVIVVYRHLQPFAVREIKQRGIKIIHINPDALTTFQSQQVFAEEYDHYFTKDPYIQKFMKDKLQLNVHLYMEAFNPRFHNYEVADEAVLEKEVNIDVLCFGNLYPYRNRMIRNLVDEGIDVQLFGHKAKYFDQELIPHFKNKAIYGDEKARYLSGAKIVFNNFHYAEVGSVNNKFFEITGSGGFQICDYKPILNDLLPIDPKRISFETLDEAKGLIRHYLNEPEERWEIRRTLKAHFLEKYTYKELIDSVLKKI